MPTYSTDLTTLTTAESGTWTEFNAPYNGGGSPGASGENFIQGTDCYAQNSGKANGLEISIVYDHGSGYTYATDEVVLAWVYYSVGTNLETYANSGWRFGIGQSTANWSWWRIGGSDYGRNPYGGWTNIAIDPTDPNTLSTDIGTGTGTTYRYYGNVPYTINEITKGDPTAVDAIRAGRGEIIVYGTGADFAGLASYNDYNAGGTPPGTSSTSVDSGRHRLGLFQDIGGVYLWKGLMTLGQSANSLTFSDSNVTIIVDDAPNTYAGFNKIEVNNASTSVTWTNVTFIGTSTTTVSDARFEMVDDATLTATGCSFNDMDTFTFKSNSTVTNSSFNNCGLITNTNGDLSGSSVLNSTVAADEGAVYETRTTSGATILSEYDNMTFEQGTNAHHAIRFGSNVSHELTLTGIEFTGFSSSDDVNGSTLRFDTASNITVNLVDCTVDGAAATTSNVGVDATATITLSINPVTTLINIKDNEGNNESGVYVYLAAKDGTGDLPFEQSITSITRSGTTATVTFAAAHGLVSNQYLKLAGITDKTEDNAGAHQVTVSSTTVVTYTTTDSGSTNYTGTITGTGAVIYGTTDASGNISSAATWGANQPVIGRARKSTTSPRFKTIELDDTISSSSGLTINRRLQLDE